MGGLFSTPSPPPPPPSPPPVDTSAADEEKMRLERLIRKRRGLRSLIKTSPSGLLGISAVSSQQKSLLGE